MCALTHLCDKISSSIYIKQFTVGIRGTALKWFCSSMLENSLVNFMVTVQRHGKYNAECPRDLSLGPCFFLYINDLCNVPDVLDFILFADDTNKFFSIMI